MKKLDLTGKQFGKLTALCLDKPKGIHRTWKCKCSCGEEIIVYQTHLIQGNTSSCGCTKIKSINYGFTGCGDIHGTRFSDIKSKAIKRNIEFSITIEYIWNLFEKQNRKCALSGLSITFGKRSKEYGTASLDRIDNSKGYVEGNVWWVHKDINKMKNVHSVEYFIELCKLISRNN